MILTAFATLVYGAILVAAGRKAASRPARAGGAALGGLALLGGALLLAGARDGRGLALLAAVLAVLFFGWSLSRAMLADRPARRPGTLLLLSLAEAALLVAA